MSRIRFGCTLAASLFLIATGSSARAQAIVDDTVTTDQTTVGTVFDAKGSAAAGGSSLETDYNRVLSGTSAEVARSAQSMLPTTAYNMTGAANALASTEERNIMGRLRTLRQSSALRPSRVAATPHKAPVVYPLQESGEALHDLRDGKKSSSTPSKYGTTNYYRSISRALYKDGPDIIVEPPSSARPRPYTSDTAVGRAATSTLNYAADVGGQGQIQATATGGMPRRVAVPLSEANSASASLYRGQPLSGLSSSSQPLPLAPATNTQNNMAPTPLTAAPPLTVIESNGYAPPVIYGPNDPIPATPQASMELPPIQTPVEDPTANVAVPATPRSTPFIYQRIDQDKGLTTPKIGTSRSTLSIRQNNAMALISSPDTNIVKRVPTRKTTDVGSYLWTDQDKATATKQEPAAANQEQEERPAPTSYGTRAIPLGYEAGINPDQRWGFFVTGTTGFGSDELQQTSEKTKTTTTGITAGADYRIQDQSYLGMALTYVHSSMTTGSFGDLQSNSVSMSLYGTTAYAQNAYADGYISLGYLNMDSERTIFAGGGTTRKAKGSPDGFQFSGKAETGYDVKQAAWTYGPFAGFRLAYADFGSFTEEDAGNFNLKVRGFNNLSAIASLGAGGTYRYAMSNGGIFLPGLRAGYNHEFGDDRSEIKAEFANLANSSFTTKSNKISRDWVNITPSVTASLPNDWTFVAQYEHDFFRDDVNENIFNLAAHYKW